MPWVPGNGTVASVLEGCAIVNEHKAGFILLFSYNVFPSVHPMRSIWERLWCIIITGKEVIHALHSLSRLLRVKLLTQCQTSRWQRKKNKNKPADVFPKWRNGNNRSHSFGWEVLCSLREQGPDEMSGSIEAKLTPLPPQQEVCWWHRIR